MRLNRAEINNFRSIKSLTVNFDPKCRVLVGINESGKSNILEALSLLDSNRIVKPDDLRNFPPDEDPSQTGYVRFVFSLEKDERIENYEKAATKVLTRNPDKPILAAGDKRLSLAQFIDSRTEGLYIINIPKGSRINTTWSLGDGYKVLSGWKKPSGQCPPTYQVTKPDGSLIQLRSIALVDASAIEGIPEQYLADIGPEDVNTLARMFIAELVKDNLPDCLYWAYSDSNLLPAQIGIDAFAANPSSCEPLRHMFLLAGISDIRAEIAAAKNRSNGIRNLLNRVADRASKHMKSVWKDYKGIAIELAPNGGNIDASIKDEHNLYDFSRRSDGFKRFITFLLMVSAKVRTKELVNTLYLHDEPDVSLHPSGARYLREELIKVAENNYVVYSTHSIFMIDRELLRRHLIVEKRAEITGIREANESNIIEEEVIYNALGYSIFENLKKHNVIFEGWRDKRLCKVALKSLPSKYKGLKGVFEEVGMCHAKGVKDIGRITPMLELAGRTWTIVSDGDKPAVEQQRQYDGDGPWYRYDELIASEVALTGEDFIKADAFKVHLEAIRSENPSLPDFPVEQLGGQEPRLVVIRRWLQENGMAVDRSKAVLDGLKERLFESLKPAQIEDRYYEFLAAVAGKLGNV